MARSTSNFPVVAECADTAATTVIPASLATPPGKRGPELRFGGMHRRYNMVPSCFMAHAAMKAGMTVLGGARC